MVTSAVDGTVERHFRPGATVAAARRRPLPGAMALPEPSTGRLRAGLLLLAAALVVCAAFLPLWGMTLVSVQYPEGLRMVIYPTRITGDITEINLLNHYIGMAEISDDLFRELRVIPVLFGFIAVGAAGASLVRRAWATLVPLAIMAIAAVYGLVSMRSRLYQFGHDLDPTAAIEIEPFTPAMLGSHTIAQFASYAYFSWGTFLPMIAGALVCGALWLDLRRTNGTIASNRSPRVR